MTLTKINISQVDIPSIMGRKIEGEQPRTVLPRGSVDSHMHVYSTQYPSRPGGPPAPSDHAGISMYRQVQEWLGLERVVVVQGNAYQTDNRCTLEALKVFGNQARAVVAVTPHISEAELLHLHALGVRGARIMELSGGAVGLQDLVEVNARILPLGWSCIVQFDGRQMITHQPLMERIRGDYVIDHAGKYLEPVAVSDPSFKALLELIDRGNCYVKLAGCYETSRTGPPDYQDLAQLSKALIAHAPERIIWGSNWPHPSLQPADSPDDAKLLDLLCSWIPDAMTLRKIFVDNPTRLYGFSEP